MKVTLQQKILGGVLVIGAIALSADRLLFLKGNEAGPSDARGAAASEYAVAPAPATIAPGQPPAVRAAAANAVAVVSIAQRLRDALAANPTTETKDAFALGSAWPTTAEKAADAPTGASSGDIFKNSHHLTGVLTSNGRAVAMVDGKLIAVGQTVDGYRLTSISHRSATFEASNSQITLNMNERANTTVAGAGQ